MPGNTTSYTSSRTFLPAIWKKTGITAGQTTGLPMPIVGITRDELPFPRRASIVSVGIVLTAVVTAGLIRFELTKNGSATGRTLDMDSTSGTKQIWEIDPGLLVGDKGDELGVLWGSSAGLLPDGTIEAGIYFEIQWD